MISLPSLSCVSCPWCHDMGNVSSRGRFTHDDATWAVYQCDNGCGQIAVRIEGSAHSVSAFERAFRELDKGKIFVRICEMRQWMKWPRADFDEMLERLRDQGTIQLHGGDNASMSEDQVRDSYIDDNGFLHLTMTWRREQ